MVAGVIRSATGLFLRAMKLLEYNTGPEAIPNRASAKEHWTR